MATKNKKIKHNINTLLEEYRSSIIFSEDEEKKLESLSQRIEKEGKNLEDLNSSLSKLEEELENLNNECKIPTNSNIKQRIVFLKDVVSALSEIDKIENKLNELDKDETKSSEEKEKDKDKLNKKLSKLKEEHKSQFVAFNKMFTFKDNSYKNQIDGTNEYIGKLETILEKRSDIAKTKEEIKAKESEISQLKKQKVELEQKKSRISKGDTLENFISFLEENNLSTIHAKEIYAHMKGEVTEPFKYADDFKMRKSHPKRDAFIKKVLIPTALTSAVIGAVIGAIAGSGLIGGSTVLGIIPVSGTPGLTAVATSIVGAVAGLIATPAIIKTKNILTRKYYKLVYKNANKNVKDFENGVNIDSLYITKLIEKIEKTKQKVLEMNHGNWFTRKLKFIPKHILNAVNRNRIHHLEAYTKELLDIYNNRNLFADANLEPIIELLKQVETFVANDAEISKLYAMLTCDNSKKHSHVATIENIDIFANLKIYIDNIAKSEDSKKQITKNAKQLSKNLKHKKVVATGILNGERLFAKLLREYEDAASTNPSDAEGPAAEPKTTVVTAAPAAKEPVVVVEPVVPAAEEPVVVVEPTVPIAEVPVAPATEEPAAPATEPADPKTPVTAEEPDAPATVEPVVTPDAPSTEPKTTVVTADPVTEEPAAPAAPATESTTPSKPKETEEPRTAEKPATKPNLVSKATQRLKYASKTITNAKGEKVGYNLKVDANGEKEEVEIRYMYSKKKIRIKTANGEEFREVDDTTIPPMDQIDKILTEIAQDNVDSLIIS